MSEDARPPEDSAPPEDGASGTEAPDTVTAIGVTVVLLAAAGVCALLGAQFLIGALRLAAGILAGIGLGAAVMASAGGRLRRRTRRVLAAAVALAAVAALTVPGILATRVPSLADAATAEVDALAEGDQVASVPAEDSPVLIRRTDGTGQLLAAGGTGTLEAAPEDLLALTADGRRLLHVTDGSTRVLTVAGDATTSHLTTLDGIPLAATGDVAVMRACTDGTCRLSGYDLAAAATADAGADGESPPALWTVPGAEETRGTDPAGLEVPAAPEDPPGLLEAARATGVIPAVPLRFDPAQGWVQLDPATGFPVGQILAGPEQDCRIAATPPAPDGSGPALDPSGQAPVVLTACSDETGAITATAFRDGDLLWESAPSPGGQWSVRLDTGRVLATGTETGTGTAGEIVASRARADWTAPGGTALEEAAPPTARIGIDGARMVVTNDAGQLLAYDTATGQNTWTLPAPQGVGTGSLESGTAVVTDPVERTRSLDPRGTARLRIIDADSGDIAREAVVTQEVTGLRGIGAGRALVATGDRTLLLGP